MKEEPKAPPTLKENISHVFWIFGAYVEYLQKKPIMAVWHTGLVVVGALILFLSAFGGGGGGSSSDAEEKVAKEFIEKKEQRSLTDIHREAVFGEEFRRANGRSPTQPEVDEYLKSRK